MKSGIAAVFVLLLLSTCTGRGIVTTGELPALEVISLDGPNAADLVSRPDSIATSDLHVQDGIQVPDEARSDDLTDPPEVSWDDIVWPDDPLPLSALKFQDVHENQGNPRKLNANTKMATEPGNKVRLYMDWKSDVHPPITFKWSATAGELTPGDGPEAFLVGDAEGEVEITCELLNQITGDVGVRGLSVNIVKGHQHGAIIRGDWVVWNLSANKIQALHLPSGAMTEVGPGGGVTSFNGSLLTSKPVSFPDHTLWVYDIETLNKIEISTDNMQTAWDHRFITVGGRRVYWTNTNTQYTQDKLYTFDLDTKEETFLFGPELLHTTQLPDERLAWTVKQAGTSPSNYNNYLYDPETGEVTELHELDEFGMIQDWHDPWVVLQDYTDHYLRSLDSGEMFTVKAEMYDVVQVEVSAGVYGGHAREPFGDEGIVFLRALDGLISKQVHFDDNDFKDPSVDGNRVAYRHNNDIYLLVAE